MKVETHVAKPQDESNMIKLLIRISVISLAYEALFPNNTQNLKWLDDLKFHLRDKLFCCHICHDVIPINS